MSSEYIFGRCPFIMTTRSVKSTARQSLSYTFFPWKIMGTVVFNEKEPYLRKGIREFLFPKSHSELRNEKNAQPQDLYTLLRPGWRAAGFETTNTKKGLAFSLTNNNVANQSIYTAFPLLIRVSNLKISRLETPRVRLFFITLWLLEFAWSSLGTILPVLSRSVN